ncbi:MAG TPA: serine hydrolase [Allosphingosinicella sp.]|nr:serine hydrolase [Allosphingosinicella sp.]
MRTSMLLLAAAGFALAASGACAQPAPSPAAATQVDTRRFAADFDAFLTGLVGGFPDLPSLSVVVTRSDGTIYARSFGRADLASGRAATPDTLYYIASTTKSFLGLAMAAMDARGEIDLDWTLAELAPDVRFAPELHADRVTLRHLLSHTHGLTGTGIAFRLAYTGEHDQATLWRQLARLQPNREAPLGTYRYTNLGYNIAALLIERRTGRRWQDMIEREVLVPLRMTHSLTQGTDRARRRLPFALPYTTMTASGAAPIYLVKHDDTMQSAGGMFASANDIARFLAAQLAAERGRGTGRLPASVIAGTHRPIATFDDRRDVFPATGYGLGWLSGEVDGAMLYFHFGGFPGARAHMSFMPARDVGVVALANDDGIGVPIADLAAKYAYTWFARGREAAAASGAQWTERFRQQFTRIRAGVATARAEQAARPWRLSLPIAAYTGRYCNEDYGTITISDHNGRPAMAMGRLRADAGPFDRPETVRMEAIPGEGRLLSFDLAGGRATALTYDGDRYLRCP